MWSSWLGFHTVTVEIAVSNTVIPALNILNNIDLKINILPCSSIVRAIVADRLEVKVLSGKDLILRFGVTVTCRAHIPDVGVRIPGRNSLKLIV